MDERFYLYDTPSQTKTRFVSFMGKETRFDLALLYADSHYGKVIVLDLQSTRFAIIGHDDLKEEGYLEFAFNLSELDAEDLRLFLVDVVG
ncbi:MAG: DUF3055 domain-containing protein [Bacilli bacterium]